MLEVLSEQSESQQILLPIHHITPDTLVTERLDKNLLFQVYINSNLVFTKYLRFHVKTNSACDPVTYTNRM